MYIFLLLGFLIAFCGLFAMFGTLSGFFIKLVSNSIVYAVVVLSTMAMLLAAAFVFTSRMIKSLFVRINR